MRASVTALSSGFASVAGAAQVVLDPATTFLPLSIIAALFVVAIGVTVKVVRILDRIEVELTKIPKIETRLDALEQEARTK